MFGTEKKKKHIDEIAEEIDYEYPDIPQLSELIGNFFLMPIIMYGGFSRLIIVSERKKTFQFVGHSQEMFLHTIPLSVLTIQNTMGGQGSPLGVAAIVVPALSAFLTFLEICIL